MTDERRKEQTGGVRTSEQMQPEQPLIRWRRGPLIDLATGKQVPEPAPLIEAVYALNADGSQVEIWREE